MTTTPASVTQLGDPWEELERGLIRQVEIVLTDRRSSPLPLGRWLIEDLVLAADNLAWGVARRASAQLGVAETTYRRQLEKIQRAQSHGLLQRSPVWADMHAIIAHLVQASKMAASWPAPCRSYLWRCSRASARPYIALCSWVSAIEYFRLVSSMVAPVAKYEVAPVRSG